MARRQNRQRNIIRGVPVYDAIAAELEADRDGDMFLERRVETNCRRISYRVAIEVNDSDPGVRVEIEGSGVEDLGFTKGVGFRLDADPEDTLDALTSIGEAIIACAHRAKRFGLLEPWRELPDRKPVKGRGMAR